MHPIDSKYSNAYARLRLILVGFAMGGANIIPGVSGGTIAFVFGIYEDLIQSLFQVNAPTMRLLWQGRAAECFKNFPWRFLVLLFAGVFVAIFSLARLMSWLLMHQRELTFAFFFGLILATVPMMLRHIRVWKTSVVLFGLGSLFSMFWLVGQVPVQTPQTFWFLFFCGALAVCTMILPGISGSFILVLLGQYQTIITAISRRDLVPLVSLGLGCVVGLISFVRALNWLLRRYHDQTMMVLTGLVVGSLRKIWPWKQVLRTIVGRKGKVIPVEEINIIPEWNAQVLWAVLLCAAGFLLALWLSSPVTKNKRT